MLALASNAQTPGESTADKASSNSKTGQFTVIETDGSLGLFKHCPECHVLTELS